MAKDKKKKKKKKGQSAEIVRTLTGSIDLTKLVHKKTKLEGKKGKKVKGIFIPFDANFIECHDNGSFYLGVRVQVKDGPDEYNHHAFIGHSVTSEVYKNASEKERDKMKKTNILGNLRDFDWDDSGDGKSKNEKKKKKSKKDDDPDDDLPF